MTVRELEEAYQRLRDQLLNGELDEGDFRTAVEQIRFQDELGNSWKIGWYTGKWYHYDQGQWIQGTPVEGEGPASRTAEVSPAADAPRRRLPLASCMVITLAGLLLAASALLIFGWNTDWWQRPQEDAALAAQATSTEEAKDPPSATPPLPTPAPLPTTPAPSSTPSPVATRQLTAAPTPRTATAVPTATSTPTPTATPRRASAAASTARVRPSTTPTMTGQIFFPVYDPNPDRCTYDIFVVDLGSGERKIMLGQASQPALSPNGGRLAYRSWDIDSRGIRLRELTDENTWPWVSYHEAEHACWSPDNLSVVFSSQQESDRKWRLYRTRGTEIHLVQREGGDVFGRVPTWSVDGRIIFWECPMGGCGLYAMHPDGTGVVRLTDGEHDTAPAVSPDGSQVAFMSNRDGNWEIYAISAYRTGPSLEEPSRLTANEARDGLPTWSPDGQWIAFVSDRQGPWAVWAMQPDGSGLQKLFDLGGPLLGEVANVPAAEQHGWTWERIAWGK